MIEVLTLIEDVAIPKLLVVSDVCKDKPVVVTEVWLAVSKLWLVSGPLADDVPTLVVSEKEMMVVLELE